MRILRAKALVVLFLVACAHEAPPSVLPQQPVETTQVATPVEPPPQYVVADQGHDVVSLGKDTLGTIVDGIRVIVHGGRFTASKDVTDPPLVGVHKMPPWMGGGFLFRSSTGLYTSESFDGLLKALVSFATEIDDVRFAPKYILVHAASGQRWPIDPKTGARAIPSPLGVVDVAALPDGRAAALAEFGAVYVTSDGGDKWIDVTSQLQGPATELRLIADEQLWLVADTGPSARVEHGGRLAFIDHVPDVKPVLLRPKDPRWKSSEYPMRRALQAGVQESERQAIIVEGGNVARVDVMTGEIVGMSAGKLPADASCEPVRTADDVLFACSRRNGGAFVAAHVLTDKAPVFEQTFVQPGAFFAGDDGGLAYGGSCTGQRTGAIVCVRAPGGVWQELEIDGSAADGGVPLTDNVRWIPRADGTVYGLVVAGALPALWDARAGTFRPLTGDPIANSLTVKRYYGKPVYTGPHIINRQWSFTPSGSVRGWADNGLSSFEVRADGTVIASPFHFDTAQNAGANALARLQGRLWQSTDRGATWNEIESPPIGTAKGDIDIKSCSPLGCDLNHWYRVGWVQAPPKPRPDIVFASGAPRIDVVTVPQLVCKAAGPPKLDAMTRTSNSPDDLGLGNAKVAVTTDSSLVDYSRTSLARTTVNPPHGELSGSSDGEEPSIRMLVHGYATDTGSNGHFTVIGPQKDPLLLRRSLSFVAPFDPAATVRRTGFGIADLVTAARVVGMTSSDVLADDPSIPQLVIPALEQDPLSPGDVAFTSELGMVGVVRASGKVKVTIRIAPAESQSLVSAAAVGTDDVALLEVDDTGLSHVSRWSGSAITLLFDVAKPPTPDLYPANPDAVAIGPHGEVGLVRTPSGGEPPTASTPALLYQSGQPLQSLAPWSTLTPADDPACKSDPGFRAIIHTTRSWIRLPREITDEEANMVARVKWSQTRVCLEGVEIRAPEVKASVLTRGEDPNERAYSESIAFGTWLVARFAGGASAVRAGIGPGVEWRQPYACTLQRTP